jgi:hypothetical protein
MAVRKERPKPHPDDFMIVAVSLEFRAKPNPNSSDPPPLDTTAAIEYAMSAAEAAEYLEKLVSAIRDRRLYGFMTQHAAEAHVGAGEWIKETADVTIPEAMVQREREK